MWSTLQVLCLCVSVSQTLVNDAIVFPGSISSDPKPQPEIKNPDPQMQPQSVSGIKPDRDAAAQERKSKSVEKCKEYSRYYNNSKEFPCGHKPTDLLNGEPYARAFVFPHMASLVFGKRMVCAGVLISDQYVLTVAHCVKHHSEQTENKLTAVRLGDLNLNYTNDEAEPQDFAVQEIIVHPRYHVAINNYDIALLKLENTVTFNEYIFPACLNTKKELESPLMVATGWGILNDTPSTWMKKSQLNITTHIQCMEEHSKYTRPQVSAETQFCATKVFDGQDTCAGDSGGPVQQYTTEPDTFCMYNVLGLTSYGFRDCWKGHPNVYTNVTAFISWIEDIVWP